MKVILDGVFNHCGSFNKWLDRERIYEGQEGYEPGAYVSAGQPISRLFSSSTVRRSGRIISIMTAGGDMIPCQSLTMRVQRSYMTIFCVLEKNGSSAPYNVDGWRLDVAADLGHSHWSIITSSGRISESQSRKQIQRQLFLAEHYGDPSSWLHGDQWDTVMNYDAFMEPITWFLTGMEKHSDEFQAEWYGNGDKFFRTMEHNMSKFQRQSLDVAMNELSNHDHSRFLTRTNSTVGRIATKGAKAANENVEKCILREAVVMQMTWPGAPTVYYGDEAGMVGWTDPDNRRSYPWGKQDWELIAVS